MLLRSSSARHCSIVCALLRASRIFLGRRALQYTFSLSPFPTGIAATLCIFAAHTIVSGARMQNSDNENEYEKDTLTGSACIHVSPETQRSPVSFGKRRLSLATTECRASSLRTKRLCCVCRIFASRPASCSSLTLVHSRYESSETRAKGEGFALSVPFSLLLFGPKERRSWTETTTLESEKKAVRTAGVRKCYE